MVYIGNTTCATMLSLQLVCKSWLEAADGEMWRTLLQSLCGNEIVELAGATETLGSSLFEMWVTGKLNSVRTTSTGRQTAAQNVAHKDMCLNLAFFGNEVS